MESRVLYYEGGTWLSGCWARSTPYIAAFVDSCSATSNGAIPDVLRNKTYRSIHIKSTLYPTAQHSSLSTKLYPTPVPLSAIAPAPPATRLSRNRIPAVIVKASPGKNVRAQQSTVAAPRSAEKRICAHPAVRAVPSVAGLSTAPVASPFECAGLRPHSTHRCAQSDSKIRYFAGIELERYFHRGAY